MRAVLIFVACGAAWAQSPPDLELFQKTLTGYVTPDGRVYYQKLHDNLGDLDRYVAQLAKVSPQSHPALFPSREARLAYWMNAYNAIVLWAFAKDYPSGANRLRNKAGQAQFFFLRKFPIGGRQRSLDDIEENSIRKEFGDPRIHFGLVCASVSCPWLSKTAFTAGNLDSELNRLTREFLSQPRNLSIDPKSGKLRLSLILKWYEKDFGGRERMLAFLGKHHDFEGRDPGKFRLQFAEYDWSLNEVRGSN